MWLTRQALFIRKAGLTTTFVSPDINAEDRSNEQNRWNLNEQRCNNNLYVPASISRMKEQSRGYLYALSAVLLWSTVATVFKISLRYVDHFGLLFYASVASTVVLFVIILVQRKTHLFSGYTAGDYARSAALGFLNPFLYYVILFKAYDLLLAQEAQTLNYVWPLALVLLSIPILKQKIGRREIIAVLISFSGALLIGTRGGLSGFPDTLGVGLALGSSVIWALFWIYNMKDGRDEVAKLFLNFLFGSIFALIAVFIFSEDMRPGTFGIAAVIYVGTFEMGITFVLWLKALGHSENTARVGNLIYLSPFISFILLYSVLHERILPSTVIGLGLIIGGIVFQRYSTNKFDGKMFDGKKRKKEDVIDEKGDGCA